MGTLTSYTTPTPPRVHSPPAITLWVPNTLVTLPRNLADPDEFLRVGDGSCWTGSQLRRDGRVQERGDSTRLFDHLWWSAGKVWEVVEAQTIDSKAATSVET